MGRRNRKWALTEEYFRVQEEYAKLSDKIFAAGDAGRFPEGIYASGFWMAHCFHPSWEAKFRKDRSQVKVSELEVALDLLKEYLERAKKEFAEYTGEIV